MVTRASRYPVLVDPQGQGRIWIMNREEANQLKVPPPLRFAPAPFPITPTLARSARPSPACPSTNLACPPRPAPPRRTLPPRARR